MVAEKRVDVAKLFVLMTGRDDDDSTGILPDETKLWWKTKIREGIAKLEAPRKRSLFRKSFYWTFNVWGFAAQTMSPASPPVGYGTTWTAFASYVQRVEAKLAALEEEEEEEEDAGVQ